MISPPLEGRKITSWCDYNLRAIRTCIIKGYLVQFLCTKLSHSNPNGIESNTNPNYKRISCGVFMYKIISSKSKWDPMHQNASGMYSFVNLFSA